MCVNITKRNIIILEAADNTAAANRLQTIQQQQTGCRQYSSSFWNNPDLPKTEAQLATEICFF